MKFRITQTAVVEFDADPKNYKGIDTPEAMLEIDLGNLRDDPESIFWLADTQENVTVTGEVIEP